MFFFHIQTPFIYDDGKNGDEIVDQPNNNLVHKYTVIQGNIFDKDFWVSKMMIINGGSSCDIVCFVNQLHSDGVMNNNCLRNTKFFGFRGLHVGGFH